MSAMSPRPRTIPLVFAAFFLVAGCEGPEQEAPEAVPAEPAQQETAAPVEEVPHTATQLEEVNGSGVSGEAMAMDSNETVVVALELEGLPAEREYAAHIHEGTCAEGGPVAVALNPVLGLDDGTGSSTTMLEGDEIPTDGDHFIQVHGEGGAPIACGDMDHEEEGPGA